MKKYSVIGIMSGTSMDGVDLACCGFEEENGKWKYEIKAAETIPYHEKWRLRLSQLYKQPIENYPKADVFYGKYLGKLVLDFISKNNLQVDFISSHGHTIFHQPENGFTAQIGDGAAIHAETNLPVVCNFRTVDVALGGQGAPLVPVGDKMLFSEYDSCLNLGGIANISFNQTDSIKAFDVCPCNIVLNRVARWKDRKFDDRGILAAEGFVDEDLLNELNALDFYSRQKNKSLGREWINLIFWPVVKKITDISEEDVMATLCAHIAFQIGKAINENDAKKILVTGGGTFNDHLMQRIRKNTNAEIIIPDEKLINFKEALIFAFLGILRLNNEVNCLSDVTGAIRNNTGGALYGKFEN